MNFKGKKTPTALVIFAITTAIGYGMVKADVKNTKEDIAELKPNTTAIARVDKQVGRIEERVDSLHENFNDFKTEQRLHNKDMEDKQDKILEAVLSGR